MRMRPKVGNTFATASQLVASVASGKRAWGKPACSMQLHISRDQSNVNVKFEIEMGISIRICLERHKEENF